MAVVAVLFVVFVAMAYFTPTLVAFARGAPSPLLVLAINLFVGWTLAGWVIALVLAMQNRQQHGCIQVINSYGPPPVWHGPAAGELEAPRWPDDAPPLPPPSSPY